MTFPVGIYKAMRSVTEGIHHISLANNELKSLTSRFVTTFSQLRGKGQPHCFATATSKPLGPSKEPPGCCRGGTAPESFPTAVFAPLCSRLIPSTSSDPQKSIFLYPFQPLQEEGIGFALTHPPKLMFCHLPATFSSGQAAAGSLIILRLPPRMGLGMKEN